jgi:transcriptional regulator GlxA family with amidase domain
VRTFARAIAMLLAVLLAVLILPAATGAFNGVRAVRHQYAPLGEDAAPVALDQPPAHDPRKPTAVMVIGANGAEVSDVLAPYEVLATTGAFNLYTVAPERRPLPLTGGLHLVPDLTFAELDARLPNRGAADVVLVPALPDVDKPSAAPINDWLRQQADGGSLMVGICSGARVLASAGLLDGREATSHWARISGLEDLYPDVDWVRGTRYVDGGEIITAGGVLSGVDGALRVVERLVSPDVARRTAEAVDWRYYSPGGPASIPALRLGPDAVLKPLNAAYRRTQTGVVLTEGVGEIELASVFDTFNGQSYSTRTVAVAGHDQAVSSRHGLRFVATADLDSVGNDLDRLVVPGAEAARRQDADLAARAMDEHGLTPEYLHTRPGFPFDAALRDLARTVDVPTARWTAKVLEYPVDDLDLSGPVWPWPLVLSPLALALTGLAVLTVVARIRRRAVGDTCVPGRW